MIVVHWSTSEFLWFVICFRRSYIYFFAAGHVVHSFAHVAFKLFSSCSRPRVFRNKWRKISGCFLMKTHWPSLPGSTQSWKSWGKYRRWKKQKGTVGYRTYRYGTVPPYFTFLFFSGVNIQFSLLGEHLCYYASDVAWSIMFLYFDYCQSLVSNYWKFRFSSSGLLSHIWI